MTQKTKAKRPRILRTPANYDEHFVLNDVEVPYGKTLTSPDQTMSVRDQLARFQSGTLKGMANPIYMDVDDDAPDFSKMDQIEIMNWREQALIQQQQLDDKFKAASLALAKKDDDERIKKAAQALLEAQRDASPEPPVQS